LGQVIKIERAKGKETPSGPAIEERKKRKRARRIHAGKGLPYESIKRHKLAGKGGDAKGKREKTNTCHHENIPPPAKGQLV